MPVLVTGFRRSGTSMAMRAINRLGVFIGEESNPVLSRVGPKNPLGFWEHPRFAKLNKNILHHINPEYIWSSEYPYFEYNMLGLPEEFFVRGRRISSEFSKQALIRNAEAWGFKNPTSALLLPFWTNVVSDFRIVWLTRHPAEVAKSLLDGKTSLTGTPEQTFEKGLRLWEHSTQHFLKFRETHPSAVWIVSEHANWIANPEAEIKRLAEFLELKPDIASFHRAASGVAKELYRFNPDTVPQDSYLYAEQLVGDTYRALS